jgi:integrase|tara:strand:- start:1380 stop:2285 length:906 start_codon:yes stop_codon:yes gene_type:complete
MAVITLKTLVKEYYLSFEFKSLRDETKQQYEYFLNVLLDTKLPDLDKPLGNIQINNIKTLIAKHAYNDWCNRGVHLANHVMSVARIVYNYAVNMEKITLNPFSNIKKRTPERRKTIWTKENVTDFLDVAYSDFKTRSIGLIAHMAYDWCQRLGDMRLLQWSNLDLSEQRMHIEQSKRRAEVFLPISDGLGEMLVQQKEDFGFQPYVAPKVKPVRGVYEPYSMYRLPKVAKRIMKEANLPDDLRLSDLRRTGTVEMVDAGVSMGNIMSVTGHANPQSVKPYMKNTFKSANLALNKRKELTEV